MKCCEYYNLLSETRTVLQQRCEYLNVAHCKSIIIIAIPSSLRSDKRSFKFAQWWCDHVKWGSKQNPRHSYIFVLRFVVQQRDSTQGIKFSFLTWNAIVAFSEQCVAKLVHGVLVLYLVVSSAQLLVAARARKELQSCT